MLNNKYIKSIINILIILLIIWVIVFFIISWSDWNQEEIKEAREKYEKNINTDFFNEMDINDLNNLILISNEKKIRYYDINRNEYSYYKDRIWSTIKKSNNIKELIELKELMIKNNVISIYNDWYIYFGYGNNNFELWYDKFKKIVIWNITNNWRVEKVINNGWFIIRKCNEYICGESK